MNMKLTAQINAEAIKTTLRLIVVAKDRLVRLMLIREKLMAKR